MGTGYQGYHTPLYHGIPWYMGIPYIPYQRTGDIYPWYHHHYHGGTLHIPGYRVDTPLWTYISSPPAETFFLAPHNRDWLTPYPPIMDLLWTLYGTLYGVPYRYGVLPIYHGIRGIPYIPYQEGMGTCTTPYPWYHYHYGYGYLPIIGMY